MPQERIILPPVPPLNLNTSEMKSIKARLRAFENLSSQAYSGNQSWHDKESHIKRAKTLRHELEELEQKLRDEHEKLILLREEEQKELDEDTERSEQKWNASIAPISDLMESSNNISEETTSINPISDLEL